MLIQGIQNTKHKGLRTKWSVLTDMYDVTDVIYSVNLAHVSWGDTWCEGWRVCLPSKRRPLRLECGFESQSGL